jgi:hypothetical protein
MGVNYETLASFHPGMVLLPNICVKLRSCLCDVLQYVSAQALVFFAPLRGDSVPTASQRVPGFLDLGQTGDPNVVWGVQA